MQHACYFWRVDMQQKIENVQLYIYAKIHSLTVQKYIQYQRVNASHNGLIYLYIDN